MTEQVTITEKPVKPLGRKAYGSIPHLPGSRMGPADHHCHPGQDAICQFKARDKHDRIIVTEKLDGSCCSIARIGAAIVPLTRAGYHAATSPYAQHHMFAEWVADNEQRFIHAIPPGYRFVGEWMAQAHGTKYKLPHEPFVIFDILGEKVRGRTDWMRERAGVAQLPFAAVLHDGGPISVDEILPHLNRSGHGAIGPVEGAVWRVERKGEFDFIAKWVRQDKQDGVLLPEISGEPAVWNWQP